MLVKTKSMLLSITILTLLTLILTVRFISNEQNDIAHLSKNQHEMIERQHRLAKEMVNRNMLAHLVTLSHSAHLQYALKTHNREMLYDLMQPLYEELQRLPQLSIGVYNFYLPDRTVLLRMHKPEEFREHPAADRPLLNKAFESRTVASGFEVGLYGLFYRIEYPVMEGSRLLGVIDIGVDFNALNIPLELNYPIKSLMLIPYQVGLQSPLAPDATDFDTAYFLQGNESAIRIYRDAEKVEDGVILHVHPRDYLPHISEIKDAQGKLLARCIFFGDITEEYGRKQHEILTHIGLGLVALVLLAFVLHKAFNEMISQLLVSERRYRELSHSLERKVKTQTAYIVQQSRLAQMGEMISMIAHQWRQPLASISAIAGTLQLDIAMDNYKKAFFQERLESITQLSHHLSSTIDDFRDFFKEARTKTEADSRSMVEAGLAIIGLSLSNHNITVHTAYRDERRLMTYPNEIKQVILNILKNAEDALLDREVDHPAIWISTSADAERSVIVIEDNAGGIDETIIDKIFDPYFSTKSKKNGTGLGLYMSKTIIEDHCRGILHADNSERGARFEIILFAEESAV